MRASPPSSSASSLCSLPLRSPSTPPDGCCTARTPSSTDAACFDSVLSSTTRRRTVEVDPLHRTARQYDHYAHLASDPLLTSKITPPPPPSSSLLRHSSDLSIDLDDNSPYRHLSPASPLNANGALLDHTAYRRSLDYSHHTQPRPSADETLRIMSFPSHATSPSRHARPTSVSACGTVREGTFPSQTQTTRKPSTQESLNRRTFEETPQLDRPFKCDICVQAFNRNHDLKRHKRIHLAVKPFPCGWCEKAFSRRDALKRHLHVKGCAGPEGATVERSVSKANLERKVAAIASSANSVVIDSRDESPESIRDLHRSSALDLDAQYHVAYEGATARHAEAHVPYTLLPHSRDTRVSALPMYDPSTPMQSGARYHPYGTWQACNPTEHTMVPVVQQLTPTTASWTTPGPHAAELSPSSGPTSSWYSPIDDTQSLRGACYGGYPLTEPQTYLSNHYAP